MKQFTHFTANEFFAHCTDTEVRAALSNKNVLNNLYKLHFILEELREKIGMPIVINSAYRDTAHNKRVGGVATSQHLQGEAADIKCSDMIELENVICSDFADLLGQVIRYPSFIHVALPNAKHPKFHFSYSK